MRGRSADATLSLHALSPCRVRWGRPAEASCRSDRQSPLHRTTIFVYNAWQRAQVCTRPVHGTQARSARGLLSRERPLCWSRGGRRPLRMQRSGGQRLTPGGLARCRSDTTAALDTAFLQKRPEETTVWLKDLASTFSAR